MTDLPLAAGPVRSDGDLPPVEAGTRGLAVDMRAVILTALAAAALVPVQAALNSAAGGDVGLLPATVLALVVAWLGGLVPAAVAVAIAAAAEVTGLLHPGGTEPIFAQSANVRLLLFVIVAMAAAWVIRDRRVAELHTRRLHETAVRERDRAALLARRLGALQAVGEELAQADSTGRVVDILVDHGRAALQADSTFAFLVGPGGRELTVLATRGFPPGREDRFRRIPLDLPLAATDAIRNGQPVFIEEPQAFVARYAHSYRELGMDPPAVAVAAVPMSLEERRFGVLGFAWGRPHPLPEDRRAFLQALARVGAAALERARLVEQEREAYRQLRETRQRQDLLAEAGRVFGLTLDYESTLRRVGELAIPLLGDACVVDIVDGDTVRRLVASGSELLGAAATALEQHPVRPGDECPVARALATGVAVSQAAGATAAQPMGHDEAQAAAIAAMEARWIHVVPLQAMDRTIGALTFLRRADRPYDAEEAATAAQLADRAVHALENARLHRRLRRLVERETRRAAELEAVLGAVAEGFLVVEPGGAVRSSNAAAARLLGGPVQSLDALLGRLLASGDRPPTELPAQPEEYRLRDRPSNWVEITAYPVHGPGSQARSMVVVCRDVTAFRQGQALREAFMGLLSHELRTPVTTIYGGAAVLTRRAGALDAETAGEVLGDIAAEADRLYRLVEDLLVLARFDEGFELGQDPVLLQRLVPAVVEQERGRWPSVTFELDIAADLPAVSGDETSITQVLRNLLSNASKYSGSGAHIQIAVEASPGGAAVRVLDQGPGIDPDESEHLFDAFYRSPSTVTLAGGAGIGLYVSRRLVDAMGGRIWAVPRADCGSEFGFALPAYATDVEGPARSHDITPGSPAAA